MVLPLANPLYDVLPGGGIVTSMRGSNALHQEMLNAKAKELENQIQQIKMPYVQPQEAAALEKAQLYNKWYGPDIQSQIGLRGAQTNKLNTMTPIEAEQMRLSNQLAQGMNPLQIDQLRLQNKYYPQLTEAQINQQNALANWRGMGGATAGVAQKDLNAFNQQLRMDNPQRPNEDLMSYNRRINQLQSAYLEGSNSFNGLPIPNLSGSGRQLLTTVQNRNAPTAIKNQAAQMDVLVNDLKDFDIDAVKALAGPEGKAKLAYAKAQMAINPDDPTIDPMARRFITAMNQSIVNMDSMRKAFGTSVVPDYVYKTIGRLTNPADSIWNDATQVGQNYKKLVETMEKNKNLLMEKVKKGVTATVPENQTNSLNKNYSQADLEHTAKKYGITVDEVKKRLGIS